MIFKILHIKQYVNGLFDIIFIQRNSMKYIFIYLIFISQLFASLNEIDSFEADFTQSITDDKAMVLTYTGHILASKPQNAIWKYTNPVSKDVYINKYEVTIVEPEIEQVIIKRIESNFSFFNMIKNAKKITENTYEAYYKNSKFIIIKDKKLIKSISYIDEFENDVKIVFKNQKINKYIDSGAFIPKFSLDFDIIRDQ